MYGLFEKERTAETHQCHYRVVDGEISLFGCNEGWIPFLLEHKLSEFEMSSPGAQTEPYRWHLPLQGALGGKRATEWLAKNYARNANAIVIDIKPGNDELFLCELLDVWGFSSAGWTPMLWHLRVLDIDENTKRSPGGFHDFVATADDHVYEFLHAEGTVKDGKVSGRWVAPKSSPTNAALLWPEPLEYFLACIKRQKSQAL